MGGQQFYKDENGKSHQVFLFVCLPGQCAGFSGELRFKYPGKLKGDEGVGTRERRKKIKNEMKLC